MNVKVPDLPREFELAAVCCAWPPSEARNQRVRERAAASIDWQRFLAIVRRHRIEGLASAALRRAGVEPPEAQAAALSNEAAQIAGQNLMHAVESQRLLGLFRDAGIHLLFIKGLPLSVLAFGNISLKKAWDIDMVVAQHDIARSAALLEEAGYERLLPPPGCDEEQARTWFETSKESLWRHRDKRIAVELHGRLQDNPLLLPGIGSTSPSMEVEVAPGIRLPTLQAEELFSYICVHGATHGWSRLKWLADVGAFLARYDGPGIEALYRRSLALGSGRSSAQALLLCSMLLGTMLPEPLEQELRRDRRTGWLVRIALRVMAGRRSEIELDQTMLGTVPILISHFFLARGWRFKRTEFQLKTGNAADQAALPLPRGLGFLRPVVAVPVWLIRRMRVRQTS